LDSSQFSAASHQTCTDIGPFFGFFQKIGDRKGSVRIEDASKKGAGEEEQTVNNCRSPVYALTA
jgi:hypothetical protein